MIFHGNLRQEELRSLIKNGLINWGGNRKLKIYGLLGCASGKRMKAENRVFFYSLRQAEENGYRPCGHCMRSRYLQWKEQTRANT
jgi:methylphosphotriester-DNA--protein-cysteine methyltransferase